MIQVYSYSPVAEPVVTFSTCPSPLTKDNLGDFELDCQATNSVVASGRINLDAEGNLLQGQNTDGTYKAGTELDSIVNAAKGVNELAIQAGVPGSLLVTIQAFASNNDLQLTDPQGVVIQIVPKGSLFIRWKNDGLSAVPVVAPPVSTPVIGTGLYYGTYSLQASDGLVYPAPIWTAYKTNTVPAGSLPVLAGVGMPVGLSIENPFGPGPNPVAGPYQVKNWGGINYVVSTSMLPPGVTF